MQTAKSASSSIDFIKLRKSETLMKYLTLPAAPLKLSYSLSKLPNLNLYTLLVYRCPAGSNSLETEVNSVVRLDCPYISTSFEHYKAVR